MKTHRPIILKFGGTSVGSVKNILSLSKIIRNCLSQNPVVVVSALSGVTNKLLSLPNLPKRELSKALAELESLHLDFAGELIKSGEIKNARDYIQNNFLKIKQILKKGVKTKANFDNLVSFGEILSSKLVAASLNEQGIKSAQIIATSLIVTDKKYSQAEFLPDETKDKCQQVLLPLMNQAVVPVITGFIGATKDGKITTLGRGGSDYTAAILGYCLEAKEVQIWTDVDGIFTTDPAITKKARLIPEVSFKEASEMASSGAKVLHPRTIRPAKQKSIPVRVLNTFHPDNPGTLIARVDRKAGVKAVTFKRKATLVNIYSTHMLFSKGYLARIFNIFAQENISVDLVSVSEVSVSVTLDNNQGLEKAVEKLKEFNHVTVSNGVGAISLIGEGIADSPILKETSALFYKHQIDIRMISLGASDVNISFVLDQSDIEKAVKLVHDRIIIKGNSSTLLRE